MRSSLFGEATLDDAKKLDPELDEVVPGRWHVYDAGVEYHVETDEEVVEDDVAWATCTCPHGLVMTKGIPRCPHVAAVLMILLGRD